MAPTCGITSVSSELLMQKFGYDLNLLTHGTESPSAADKQTQIRRAGRESEDERWGGGEWGGFGSGRCVPEREASCSPPPVAAVHKRPEDDPTSCSSLCPDKCRPSVH